MARTLSSHAKTILSLLNNASELTLRHHEYPMARDVIKATEKVCGDLGFDIDNERFEYIFSSIGRKRPEEMQEVFDRFAKLIITMDVKMDGVQGRQR